VGIRTKTRGIERLTALQVKRAGPGVHTDGGNLYLRVGQDAEGNVTRQWTFRYTSPVHRVIDADGNVTQVGKRREAGLGNADKVSLAAAREQAARLRDAIALHRDPLDELRAADEGARAKKQAEIAAKRAERMRDRHTLRRVARDYHERVVAPHRSDRHAAQWISSIETHVPATILDRPIEDIEAKELLDLLLSLRTTVRETGRRIAQRLGLIFADAKLRGLAASNPISDIRPALRESKRDRQKSVKNFAALPFAKITGFVGKLRETSAMASLALEFLIRTAARTGEVIGAKWSEVDLDARIWTVPASRMKAGEPHTVFLTGRAAAILAETKKLDSVYCFPSPVNEKQPLSNMAMLNVLKRFKVDGRTTVHGMRSAFSSWAYESCQRQRPDLARQDVIEACLAHQEANKTKAAYSRSRFDDDRRELLQLWSAFIDSAPAKVIDITPGKRDAARSKGSRRASR